VPTTASAGARGALLALLLVALAAPGCTIRRTYLGSPVRIDALAAVIAGQTTKGEVLTRLGPPDGIVRQFDGDIFVYRYVRQNSATFRLEEPVFTNFEFFTWTRSQQRYDSIVVLFDEAGVVSEVGSAQGTEDLRAF
jgi:hypothetical protein